MENLLCGKSSHWFLYAHIFIQYNVIRETVQQHSLSIYYIIMLSFWFFFSSLFFGTLFSLPFVAFLFCFLFFSLSRLHFFLIFIMIFKSTFNIDDTENGINHERSTFYFAFSQYCQMILIQFLFLPHASFINGYKSNNEFDTEN